MYKDGNYLCFDAPTGQVKFHEDLKYYHQLLTIFRAESEQLSKFVDAISEPSSALESISEVMLRFVENNILMPLADCGEYSFVAEDFLKSNTGCALLYDSTQRYYNFANEFRARVNKSINIEKQKASINAGSQIQGTGVGIITNNLSTLALYSAFDSMVAGLQANKAQRDYDEEAMRLDLLAGKTVSDALNEHRRNVYAPQAKQAVLTAFDELLKSFCGCLEKLNRFDMSCLSGIDEARSNAVMERLDVVPSKQALFYTAVQLCPYNLSTYLLAECSDVPLDTAAKEIMDCFGLTEAITNNIESRVKDRLSNGVWDYFAYQGDVQKIAFLTEQSERAVCKSLFLVDYQEDIASYCRIVTAVKSGRADVITNTVSISELEEGDERLAFYSACGFPVYNELSRAYGRPLRSLSALANAVNEAWIAETTRAEQERAAAKRETDRIAAAQAGEEERKRKKRVKILIAVLVVAIVAAIWALIVVPYTQEQKALELLAEGKYEEARAMFEGKPDMLKECDYQWYKQQLEQGDCSADVKKGFKELGDYKDSQGLLKECEYQWYKQQLEQGDCSIDVETGLEKLGDYKDSTELIKEAKYQRAIQFMNEGEYYSAYRLFDRVGDYKDAADNATEMKYLCAKEKFEEGNYTSAKSYLAQLGNYKDSVELLKKCG